MRRVALEVLGWVLVVAGIAALILPGPGLLLLFAGLAVLSGQYEWAERRLEPVKVAAFKTAADSVQSWPRVIGAVLGAGLITAAGVVWCLQPAAPSWWPVRESFWLLGGWPAGVTLILSGFIALAMIVYSFKKFRGVEDYQAVAEADARD